MANSLMQHGKTDIEKLATDKSVVDQWLLFEIQQNNASAATSDAYRRGLGVFVKWMQEVRRSYPTPRDILDFKTYLLGKYSSQTTNLRLASLRSFYRYLVTHDLAIVNPAQFVKNAKRPSSRTHKRGALSRSEVKAVLAAPDTKTPGGKQHKAILSLMAFCGLRQCEVSRANIGNLKTQGDRLVLEIHGKGRTGADDICVIPAPAHPSILAWFAVRQKMGNTGVDAPLFVSLSRRNRGTRLSTQSIQRIVKSYYKQAGVVNIGGKKTTHSLRHSAANAVMARGGSVQQVQALLRHQSLDTPLIYLQEFNRLQNAPEDLISYD